MAGKPLLSYTCEAALASKRLTRVVLSTEDPAIAEIGKQWGVEIPFFRPAALAKDETPSLDVVQHVLRKLQENECYQPTVIVLLQPTSPLRRPEHIDQAVDILLETRADSVVSVMEVPHQFSPVSLMELKNEKLVSLQEGGLPILRRQDKPRLYARNGPAVLAVRTQVIMEGNNLYGKDCRPFVMDPLDSIDIDGPADIEIAEFLLLKRQHGSHLH